MLTGAEELFQSVKSIKFVCYRVSEVADEEQKRLLRELPEAGVTLIELDGWEQEHGRLRSLTRLSDDPDMRLCDADLPESGLDASSETERCDLHATLLLAGSAQTLALAQGTPAATVGYGRLAIMDADEAAVSGNAQDTKEADILVEGFDEVDVQFLDRIMKRAQGLPWITAVTERCYLREMTLADLDDLYALYAQPGITDYVEPLYDRLEEEQYTKDYIAYMYRFYGYGMWLVCDRKTGALIGRAGFSHQDLGDETVLEMGYIIGVPYQRQGYAMEVCEKLISFAREHLSDFGTLNCLIEPGNTASHALAHRLGFTEAGMADISGKRMVRYELGLDEKKKTGTSDITACSCIDCTNHRYG